MPAGQAQTCKTRLPLAISAAFLRSPPLLYVDIWTDLRQRTIYILHLDSEAALQPAFLVNWGQSFFSRPFAKITLTPIDGPRSTCVRMRWAV